MGLKDSFLIPEWPAPNNVRAVVTTRHGGSSVAPYDGLNLAYHVGDEPTKVVENRRKLLTALNEIAPCGPPQWLQQVHGTDVVDAFSEPKRRAQTVPEADAVTYAPQNFEYPINRFSFSRRKRRRRCVIVQIMTLQTMNY